MRDADPTIRDEWHTELRAERCRGMLVSCVLAFSYALDAEAEGPGPSTRVDPSSAGRLEGFFV